MSYVADIKKEGNTSLSGACWRTATGDRRQTALPAHLHQGATEHPRYMTIRGILTATRSPSPC